MRFLDWHQSNKNLLEKDLRNSHRCASQDYYACFPSYPAPRLRTIITNTSHHYTVLSPLIIHNHHVPTIYLGAQHTHLYPPCISNTVVPIIHICTTPTPSQTVSHARSFPISALRTYLLSCLYPPYSFKPRLPHSIPISGFRT